MKSLFYPRLPAEEWAAEREKIAARKPHLSLVAPDPRPDPDMYRWVSVSDVIPVREEP